jgi:hypothetical protein
VLNHWNNGCENYVNGFQAGNISLTDGECMSSVPTKLLDTAADEFVGATWARGSVRVQFVGNLFRSSTQACRWPGNGNTNTETISSTGTNGGSGGGGSGSTGTFGSGAFSVCVVVFIRVLFVRVCSVVSVGF